MDAVKEIKKGAVKATGHAVFPENQLDSFGVHTLYGFIVQGAKVRIDPISGAVNVLEVHNVTEAGRIMNPVSVAGQMYGGIVMSTGYAISEGTFANVCASTPCAASTTRIAPSHAARLRDTS